MIALFGAGGFLGQYVQEALKERELDYQAFARRDANICDIADLRGLNCAPAVVVNLAARVPASGVSPESMMRINAEGAVRLCQWAIESGAKHYVYGSTLSVIAGPWPVPVREEDCVYPKGKLAPYSASKLAGEIACRALCDNAGVTFGALRFSALYGEKMAWQGVMPLFIDMALDGRIPKVNANGKGHADFLHAECAAKAVISACERDAEGVFNIASGTESSILGLAQLCLNAADREESVLVEVEGEATRALVDTARMRLELCSVPQVSLEQGVKRLLDWRRDNPQNVTR